MYGVFKMWKEIENKVLIYKEISKCVAKGITAIPVLLKASKQEQGW